MAREVRQSVMEAVGNTPLVQLGRLFPAANVVAKLEYMNPGGSIKDRMVRHMLKHLPAGTRCVVESSSGNTGAALAMASAVRQLGCEITVPATTSGEKIKRIATYGAKVHVCADDREGGTPSDYLSMAKEIAARKGAFLLDQYCSELNREAHYVDTGPELWKQLDGEIDVFVCGIGSGGTISGVGRYLKERNPAIRVIGVEPVNSSYRDLLENRESGSEFASVIEGIGKRHPSLSFDPTVVDEVIQVADEEGLAWVRRLAQEEGILAGGSSGSVTAGIARLLPRLEGMRVATIFPDSGVFYLSKYF
ncbi:PLP-dependent cysteine synthase family protein [Massilia sp. ST3]|uniref:PLP-dependent cysteine synthase family protein n=1 Tax=Massilia sp. ST3 TaxID=2824903 RepID=UPI001E3FB002|nr:cysteine synthase family protein [Massilia sp. ST3]